MARITKIVQQKKQNRVNLYLDGKFVFGLPLELVLEEGLKKGQVLSTEDIERLKRSNRRETIYNQVFSYATLRPRSKKEISDWFHRQGVPSGLRRKLLARLTRIGLVDDASFAKWWIEQRVTFRNFSRRFIKLELRRKGVEHDVIEQAFAEIEVPHEEDIARRAYEKRKKIWTGLSIQERKRKAYNFLARRGFSYDIIRRIVDGSN